MNQTAASITADNALSKSQRRAVLTALFTTSFAFGLAFGGLAPLIALTLEARGVDAVVIGWNSAMSSVGVVCGTQLVPILIRRLGPANAYFAGMGLTLVALAALPFLDSLAAWFVLRFLIGIGIAAPWVISETWINIATEKRTRGRVMAIYVSLLAAGPAVLTVVGTEGATPFYWCTAVFVVCILPIVGVRKLAPTLDFPEHARLRLLAMAAPSIFGAALLAGFYDSALFSFLPIYGLWSGLTEEYAITLLTLFVVGNIVVQIPIGWLADRVNRRAVLIGCGVVAVIGPVLVPLMIGSPLPLAVVLLIWGGGAWSVYGVALAMLGDRFRGGELAAANAAFVMAFELANIGGPPLAGFAIELWRPNGLMVMLGVVALVFVVLTAGRGLIRR